MSGTTVGTAYVQIVPSAQGIEANITNALKGDSERAGDSIGSSLGTSIVGAVSTVIAASAAAITAAVGAVVAGAVSTAEMGDEIDKTSQKMGVSAEAYQTLAFAAEHCGFETSVFMQAQRKLADTDFNGSIVEALDSVMELGTAEERTAKATELFGARAAQQMQPLLNGEQTISDYGDQLKSLGGLMSDDMVKSSAAFEDSLTDMQTAFTGVKNAAMGELLPSMTMIMDGISGIVSGDEGGIQMLSEGITSFIDTALTALPQLLEVFGSILESIGGAILDHLPEIISMGTELIVQLAVGIVQATPQIIEQLPFIIDSICTALAENTQPLIDAGVLLFTSLITNLPQIISTLVSGLGLIVQSLLESLGIAIQPFIEKGSEIVKNILQGIKNWIGTAKQTVTTFGSNLVTSLKTGLGNLWQVGKDWVQGLVNGISDSAGWIAEKIRSVCSNALEAVKAFFGIHSPSTVMYAMGEFLMQGLANGIHNSTELVTDEMNWMSATALNSSLSIDGNVTSGIGNNSQLGDILGALNGIRSAGHITIMKLNNRELGRALREEGVLFA